MTTDALFSPCPVCKQAPLAFDAGVYKCAHCNLTVKQQSFLGIKAKDQYKVQAISSNYSIAGKGIIGSNFTQAELNNFSGSLYSNLALAEFAAGNYDNLIMPSSTLAQVLLEQLRETCYVQINGLRRAHGPVLEAGGNGVPDGIIPSAGLDRQDEGNLFLTDIRLVFPSNSFTFIRLDRKLTGLKTFENGVAIQRKGDDFATCFVGCYAHQAILISAYIQGKVKALR